MAFGRRQGKGAQAAPPEVSAEAGPTCAAAGSEPVVVPAEDLDADAPATREPDAPASGAPTSAAAAEPAPESEPLAASSGSDDAVGALSKRIESLELAVAKVLAEAKQTGDFVNRMSATMGVGVDAIRSETRSEARETLMRGHGAIALARLRAESDGDSTLAASLARIEADFGAELHFFDITPIIPSAGEPVTRGGMRVSGDVPEGVDPSTARPVVATVTACGYQLPDRRIPPTVTVRWETAGVGTDDPTDDDGPKEQ